VALDAARAAEHISDVLTPLEAIMRSSFEVSVGLATPDGIWIGFRLKREIHTLVADRNAEAALEVQRTGGGPLVQNERPMPPLAETE
jgi:hypothetical protein